MKPHWVGRLTVRLSLTCILANPRRNSSNFDEALSFLLSQSSGAAGPASSAAAPAPPLAPLQAVALAGQPPPAYSSDPALDALAEALAADRPAIDALAGLVSHAGVPTKECARREGACACCQQFGEFLCIVE